MEAPFELQPALWTATACPAPDTPALPSDVSTDVCVIGGGYAGLSTALHLAERGTHVVVLEARAPGWGGSGRNGGQVIPGLKYDPDELIAKFGAERGEQLIAFGGGTADLVFDLIDKHKMEVPYLRKGWIQAAHSEAGRKLTEQRAAQWIKRGVKGVQVLDRNEAERLIGNDRYLGGWVDPRAGALQPLSYARELARVAIAAGAKVHGQSPVTSLERASGKWQVKTASGATVTADKVIMCTNGYTGGLVPKLAETIIAANSIQIATAPLSENVRRSILPEGHFVSDTRNLLFYFRQDHEGRMLIGGRGPFREPKDASDWSLLERVITRLFPQIGDTPIVHRWGGRVAVTRDFLPHLHEPQPGLLIDIGCMGRGVGLQTAMGKAMAAYAVTGDARELPFPLSPIKSIPLHQLRRAYLAAYVIWYRMLDGGVR